jgi:hypothetical protein
MKNETRKIEKVAIGIEYEISYLNPAGRDDVMECLLEGAPIELNGVGPNGCYSCKRGPIVLGSSSLGQSSAQANLRDVTR